MQMPIFFAIVIICFIDFLKHNGYRCVIHMKSHGFIFFFVVLHCLVGLDHVVDSYKPFL